MAWKRVSVRCPHCKRYGLKLILQKRYIRKEYLSIFVVQCERCGYVFEHRKQGKSEAELRKKYHLTRHEESLIRRQAAQPLIKMMAVDGKEPTNDDIAEVRKEVERLAGVAKMLREIDKQRLT